MAKCPRCQAETDAEAKFCSTCGAAREQRCQACDNRVEPTAKFCPECGTPQSTTRPQAGVRQREAYRGRAFILPGTEVLLGQSITQAKALGITSELNVAVVDGISDRHFTLLWTDTHRLFDDANMYSKGWAMTFELVPWTRLKRGVFTAEPIQEVFFKNESHQIEGSNVFLRGPSVVPVPADFNIGLDALVSKGGTSLASIGEYLAITGWATTVAMHDSIQVQRSSVNMVAAAFLLLLGIAPGLLYLLVKHGRPKILNVRLESLDHEYEIVRFSHHGMAVDEVMAIVSDGQKDFSPESIGGGRATLRSAPWVQLRQRIYNERWW